MYIVQSKYQTTQSIYAYDDDYGGRASENNNKYKPMRASEPRPAPDPM